MQSYWMTTFSSAASAETASRERTRNVLRIMKWSPGSELDLELAEDGGPPAGAGLEGTVAAAVEVLVDGVDLPAGPAVEPDVGAEGDGLVPLAVDAAQSGARDLRLLHPQDRLDAAMGLAAAGPEGRLHVAAAEPGPAVLEIGAEPLGVEGAAVVLPVEVAVPGAAGARHGDAEEAAAGVGGEGERLQLFLVVVEGGAGGQGVRPLDVHPALDLLVAVVVAGVAALTADHRGAGRGVAVEDAEKVGDLLPRIERAPEHGAELHVEGRQAEHGVQGLEALHRVERARGAQVLGGERGDELAEAQVVAVADESRLGIGLHQGGAVRGRAVDLHEQLVAVVVVGREVEAGAGHPEGRLRESRAVVAVGVGEGGLGVAVEPEQRLAVRRLDEEAAALGIEPRGPRPGLSLLELPLHLGLDPPLDLVLARLRLVVLGVGAHRQDGEDAADGDQTRSREAPGDCRHGLLPRKAGGPVHRRSISGGTTRKHIRGEGGGQLGEEPYLVNRSAARTDSARPASSGPAVFTQQRSTSATLQAWDTQPRGV